ncbi:MAG: hypothetical protein JWM31_1655, partial [Solirubrobacterales bacterium]|nr:hypothetical protein [Solirubrobacterales bacterium]
TPAATPAESGPATPATPAGPVLQLPGLPPIKLPPLGGVLGGDSGKAGANPAGDLLQYLLGR